MPSKPECTSSPALPQPMYADRAGAPQAQVTIIVSPRERFNVARESLLSVLSTSGVRHDLIYIDIGGSAELSGWLAEQAELRGFRLVQPGHFVNPNEARNIGLRLCQTPYVVFIDNDVICSPGWLEALLACAEEENADLVTPLICHGLPAHTNIHHAGGRLVGDVDSFFAARRGTRKAVDDIRYANRTVAEVGPHLKREMTETCEFHCLLARRSLFDRIGLLDERLFATREHVDLCLSTAKAGGKLFFEPQAVVTYLFPSRTRPMGVQDWHYFALRWSPQWQRRSIQHYEAKWGLQQDTRMASRGWLNWRLYEGMVKPMVRAIPGASRSKAWQRVLGAVIGRSATAVASLVVAADLWRRKRRAGKAASALASRTVSAHR